MCIYPTSSKGVNFAPRECVTNSTRCAKDRMEIRSCALCLAFTSMLERHTQPSGAMGGPIPRQHVRHARLVDALLAGPVAVVGDSMARQAFVTLVARLRGADLPVVDFNVHHNVYYRLFASDAPPGSLRARLADGLGLQHLPLDWLATHEGGKLKQRSVFDWAEERAGGMYARGHARELSGSAAGGERGENGVHGDAGSRHVRGTTVGYFWAPCSYNLPEAARAVHAPGPFGWRRVVIFAPAYWHLTGGCGAHAFLNATDEAVLQIWRPLMRLSNSSLVYTLVTPPTENVRAGWAAHQRALNARLCALFAAGRFPPNWRVYDWASVTAGARHRTVSPMGDQKMSWHYACQFYRLGSWYAAPLPRRRPVVCRCCAVRLRMCLVQMQCRCPFGVRVRRATRPVPHW